MKNEKCLLRERKMFFHLWHFRGVLFSFNVILPYNGSTRLQFGISRFILGKKLAFHDLTLSNFRPPF